MAQRASKTKPNNQGSRPYAMGPPAGNGKSKMAHHRSTGPKVSSKQGGSSAGYFEETPVSVGSESSDSPSSPLESYHQQNQHQHQHQHHHSTSRQQSQSFSLNHQRAIFEHRLITKNSGPQKNYSHVPCRFFRQGACQAGDSCPFSHSLNPNAADATPCKYFERGHCRFGSKCANAHILSDGTRLNPPRPFHQGQGHGNGNKNSNSGPPAPMPIPLRDIPLSQLTKPKIFPSATSQLQSFSNNSSTRATTSAASTPNIQQYSAMGSNTSYFAPFTPQQQQQLANDFALIEEDEDDVGLDFDGEDFIPGELSDLLTPKELERRNSRSSLSRKLSWTDHSSAFPSASSTLLGSDPLNQGEPASAANSFSGLSSATSIEYSPPGSGSMAFGLAAPSFDYTYLQDQRQARSVWTKQDQPQMSSHYVNVDRLGLLMSGVRIKDEPEERSSANGQKLHQFYLGDLHQQV
ncbi:Lee1p LALA0_S04e04236g [Lachancea lanzarotensis]|uniref:LALA0S04e04236g1_1 n=1 Tax=Lachancea lanzarotensis TaxID=1245769 RepID=A0A0C7N1U3_9SACH|nr:uncharacterized protein LALA0_S04e04236g [Lachancea lanzarotensis]CEP61946.1 LALA0S04e04236g1_1 [Lachancea lanzarotensis]